MDIPALGQFDQRITIERFLIYLIFKIKASIIILFSCLFFNLVHFGLILSSHIYKHRNSELENGRHPFSVLTCL